MLSCSIPAQNGRQIIKRWTGSNRGQDAGERQAVLAAGLLFFFLLSAIMILRPVRETLGMAKGIENIRRLFLVTVACTLLLVPLFGWMASRIPRRWLIAGIFRACSLILLAFFACFAAMPEPIQGLASSAYYIFHSVFNLFVVSLFWALMADFFNFSESKRLFPIIALGGSLGAIVGSLISWRLVHHIGMSSLFPCAILLLELAVWASRWFVKSRAAATHMPNNGLVIGGSWLAGIKAIGLSSYIRGIGGFVALNGLITTFLYFMGLRLVAAATNSPEHQIALFAQINLWTQLATLLAQAFLAGPIMRIVGVGFALAVLPMVSIFGSIVLAFNPTLVVFTIVNALFRAAQQGISGPAEETLFTVLDRQQKYKAKCFIDTFGYRAGDASGAHLERILSAIGCGLLPFVASVLGLASLWLGLSYYLGLVQNRLASNCQDATNKNSFSSVGSASRICINTNSNT